MIVGSSRRVEVASTAGLWFTEVLMRGLARPPGHPCDNLPTLSGGRNLHKRKTPGTAMPLARAVAAWTSRGDFPNPATKRSQAQAGCEVNLKHPFHKRCCPAGNNASRALDIAVRFAGNCARSETHGARSFLPQRKERPNQPLPYKIRLDCVRASKMRESRMERSNLRTHRPRA